MTRNAIIQVGGSVRDEIMGRESHDLDFTVVMDGSFSSAEVALDFMISDLEADGFDIFKVDPEFFTVRAHFPKSHPMHGKTTADFVMARIDGPSTDGRHPDFVRPGSLMDDLARRDFTMNAIAKDLDGFIFDPFDGQADIKRGVVRAVGDASKRFQEDSLRVLRAIRFAVVLDFTLDSEIIRAFHDPTLPARLASVSPERKREELNKAFSNDLEAAFRANTLRTLDLLAEIPKPLRDALFEAGNLRLSATQKKK